VFALIDISKYTLPNHANLSYSILQSQFCLTYSKNNFYCQDFMREKKIHILLNYKIYQFVLDFNPPGIHYFILLINLNLSDVYTCTIVNHWLAYS